MSEEQSPQATAVAEAPEQVTETQEVNPMGSRFHEAEAPPEPIKDEDVGDDAMQDMMVKRLYEDMGLLVDEEEKPVSEDAAEEEAEPEVKEEAKEEAKEEPKPAKRKKSVVQDREEFKKDIIEALSTVAEKGREKDAPLPVPEPEPVDDESGLMEEQKMELELAEYAEQQLPDKYNGMRAKTLKFYKDLDAWFESKRSDDPEFNAENNSEEINDWVDSHKPVINKVDERKLERRLIRDQAMKEFEKKSESKFKELELKTLSIEEAPKIAKDVNTFRDAVLSVDDIEAAKLIKDGKADEAKGKYPMQSQIADNVVNHASKVYKDFLDYDRGLTEWSNNNESHKWLNNFLSEQGKFFYSNGGDNTVRNGKNFLPVDEFNGRYHSNPQATDSRYWTFDKHDVRELLSLSAQQQIKSSITAMENQIKEYGYTRAPVESAEEPKGAPQEAPEPEPVSVPRSKVSSSPGQASPEVADMSDHPGHDIVNALGMKDKFPDVVE